MSDTLQAGQPEVTLVESVPVECVRVIVIQLERVEREIQISNFVHDLATGTAECVRLLRIVVWMHRMHIQVAVVLGAELYASGVWVHVDQIDLEGKPVDTVANLRWQS